MPISPQTFQCSFRDSETSKRCRCRVKVLDTLCRKHEPPKEESPQVCEIIENNIDSNNTNMDEFKTNDTMWINEATPKEITLVENYPNKDKLHELSKVDILDPQYKNNFNSRDITPLGINEMRWVKTIILKGNSDKITYTKKNGLGRFWASGSCIQNGKGVLRRYIHNGEYCDIDIKNCMPSILLNMCKNYGIECVNLENLVYSRDSFLKPIMNAYDCPRSVAKDLIISVLMGASYNKWIKTYNKKHNSFYHKANIPCIENLIEEIEKIKYQLKVSKLYTICENHVEVNKQKNKDYSIRNSAIAFLCQEVESRIMYKVIQYMEMKGIAVTSLIHDGCNIPKIDNVNDICKQLKNYIWNTLGLNIDFENKPTDITSEDMDYFKKNMVFHDDSCQIETDTYQSVKAEMENEKKLAMICNPPTYCMQIGNEIVFYKKSDLMNIVTRKYYEIDEEGVSVKHSFLQRWFEDEERKTYERVDFLPPPMKCPSDVLNIYHQKKFFWEDGKMTDETREKAQLLMDHILLCAENNPSQRDYIVKYMLHMVLYPGILPRVCLVFKSDAEGTGKGSLLKIMEAMLMRGKNDESDLYHSTSSFAQDCLNLGGVSHMGKVLVNADECSYKETKSEMDKIKNFITEKHLSYRALFKGSMTMKNCCRLIITTNNSTPVAFTKNTRRFVCFDIPEDRKADYDYFDKLNEYIECPDIMYSLIELMKENIGDTRMLESYSFEANRPITEAFEDMAIISIPMCVRWIEAIVLDKWFWRKELDIKKLTSKWLYDYSTWCMKNNVQCNLFKETFSRELKNRKVPFEIKKNKVGTNIIFNRNDLFDWLVKKEYTDVSDLDEYDNQFLVRNDYDSE